MKETRLEPLLQSVKKVIGRLMKRGHRPADAEDIAQKALIKTWVHLDAVEDGKEVGYFWMTAKNLGVNAFERTRQTETFDESKHAERPPTPEQEAIARQEYVQFLARFKAAFSRLPEETRLVLILRDRDLSYKEIATTLGCTSQSARTRASRAMQFLEEKFK